MTRVLGRNHLVSTLEAIAKKKKRDLLVTVWEPGQDTQNKDTRDNGHVRQPYSRNSSRATLRSPPHARRPTIVDTSKAKAQIWAKGSTQRAIHPKKRKTKSKKKKSHERIYRHYGLMDSKKIKTALNYSHYCIH